MKILYVYTPTHTGTHFILCLLQLHPKISYVTNRFACINGEPLSIIARRFDRGEVSAETFTDNILSTPSVASEIATANTYIKQICNEPIMPKQNITYKLFHIHTGAWGPTTLPFDNVIITVRDPLLSYISVMKRSGTTATLLAGIKHCSKLNNCMRFCIDLKMDPHIVFEKLGLDTTPQIETFISKYPVIGETTDDVAKTLLSDYRLGLIKKAQKALLEEHKITMPFINLIDDIRLFNLEPYYRDLGYTDLLWFKDSDVSYDIYGI
jgi:hypothetical protein